MREPGAWFGEQLQGIADRTGQVRAIRGKGPMWGMDVHEPAAAIIGRAFEQGLLLVSAGLLARYDQMSLLETLRDACSQRHDVPGYVVLVAADAQRPLPVLDDKPIPVIHASEWARISEYWITNRHRAQG